MSRLRRLSSLLSASIIALGSLTLSVNALAVITIPGLLEVEDYNAGGEGVGYHDRSSGNGGNAMAYTDDVDINITSGRVHLYDMRNTEWIKYDVNITTAGTYTLEVMQARGATPATMNVRVELDG